MGREEAEGEIKELRNGVRNIFRLLDEGIEPEIGEVARLTDKDYAYHLADRAEVENEKLLIKYTTLESARVQTEGARNSWHYTNNIYSRQVEVESYFPDSRLVIANEDRGENSNIERTYAD